MMRLLVLTEFTKHDRRTPHDDIGHACIALLGEN